MASERRTPRTKRAAIDAASAATGVLQPAVCPCGHVGKSKNPKWYRCGFCYYTASAEGNEDLADKLIARASKLRLEAEAFRARALAFRQKNLLPPGAPGRKPRR